MWGKFEQVDNVYIIGALYISHHSLLRQSDSSFENPRDDGSFRGPGE